MGFEKIMEGETTLLPIVELRADYESDVAKIPKTYPVGSTVFVIETSNVYMMQTGEGSPKDWKLI